MEVQCTHTNRKSHLNIENETNWKYLRRGISMVFDTRCYKNIGKSMLHSHPIISNTQVKWCRLKHFCVKIVNQHTAVNLWYQTPQGQPVIKHETSMEIVPVGIYPVQRRSMARSSITYFQSRSEDRNDAMMWATTETMPIKTIYLKWLRIHLSVKFDIQHQNVYV